MKGTNLALSARRRPRWLSSEILRRIRAGIASLNPAATLRDYRVPLRAGIIGDLIFRALLHFEVEPRAGVDRSHGLLDVCEMKGTRSP